MVCYSRGCGGGEGGDEGFGCGYEGCLSGGEGLGCHDLWFKGSVCFEVLGWRLLC